MPATQDLSPALPKVYSGFAFNAPPSSQPSNAQHCDSSRVPAGPRCRPDSYVEAGTLVRLRTSSSITPRTANTPVLTQPHLSHYGSRPCPQGNLCCDSCHAKNMQGHWDCSPVLVRNDRGVCRSACSASVAPAAAPLLLRLRSPGEEARVHQDVRPAEIQEARVGDLLSQAASATPAKKPRIASASAEAQSDRDRWSLTKDLGSRRNSAEVRSIAVPRTAAGEGFTQRAIRRETY